jgi:hypothetical protein
MRLRVKVLRSEHLPNYQDRSFGDEHCAYHSSLGIEVVWRHERIASGP